MYFKLDFLHFFPFILYLWNALEYGVLCPPKINSIALHYIIFWGSYYFLYEQIIIHLGYNIFLIVPFHLALIIPFSHFINMTVFENHRLIGWNTQLNFELSRSWRSRLQSGRSFRRLLEYLHFVQCIKGFRNLYGIEENFSNFHCLNYQFQFHCLNEVC